MRAVGQELGRAARNENNGHFVLLFNENKDDQRFGYWTRGCSDQEKEKQEQDFLSVWRYVYEIYIGQCLRKQFVKAFGNNPEELSVLSGHECCDSFQEEQLKHPQINSKETATTVINAIQELCGLSRFNDGVNEGKLVSFIRGSNQEWLKEGDVQPIIEKSDIYGSGMRHDTTWWSRALRQCVALGFVDIAYKVSLFNNFYKTSRRYVASMKGKCFVQNPYDISVLDPSVDPFNPKKKSNSINSVKSTTSRGTHFLPKVRKLLKDKSSWVDIRKKDDYEFPGFSENNGKLMFTQDFKTLPYAAKNRVHFISEDNQLTTRGSQKQKV